LVDAVLDELKFAAGQSVRRNDDAVATPYLQLVMWRLWESEMAQGSSRLRLRTLAELGGAKAIVRTHVDRALQALTEDDRELAADILSHLVTPSGTKIALTVPDLTAYTGRSDSEVSTLLERLASSDTRILRPVPPPSGMAGMTTFEISHDLLGPTILDWHSRNRAAQPRQEAEQQRRKRWRKR
jgi:hypothetical protein